MNPILARFQDAPSLVDPMRMEMFQSYAEQAFLKLSQIEAANMKEAASESFWYSSDDWRSAARPYNVVNGILHVPVRGILINNFPWQLDDWATGYEYIRKAVERGVADPDVSGILLVIESGGGMVSGNWELVEYLAEARNEKPMHAVANDYAFSAAYNIAAAAGPGNLTVTRTGSVGSIGVIITHFEYSKMLDNQGVTVNIIRSKPGKAEGNRWEALSEGARARLQSDVDELHEQFVNMVATNRSMSDKSVDSTNAHTFMGENAIKVGLADHIGSLDDAVTAFEATILEGERPMADYTQAQYDAAVKTAREEGKAEGVTEGHAKGLAEGKAEGKTEASERITTIMGSDEAKARPKAALTALKSSMSAEEAVSFLADLDPEAAVDVNAGKGAGAKPGVLEAALEKHGKSDITTDEETEEGDDKDEGKKAQSRASAALDSVHGARK